MRRNQNQDRFGFCAEAGLFVVADGMGGHRGGEIASQIAVDTLSSLAKTETPSQSLGTDGTARLIASWIAKANEQVYARATREPELNGMGTTTTCLYLEQPSEPTESVLPNFKPVWAWIGHVGDSRCYWIRNFRGNNPHIWQLTRDHSLVQEKVRAGIISRNDAAKDPMRNMITRSVGYEPSVNPEIYLFKNCTPGDAFLICSDGLHGLVSDAQMLQIISQGRKDPTETISAHLVDAANKNGGEDNITALLCVIEPTP